MIPVKPLDSSSPTYVNPRFIEAARPERRDGEDGYVVQVAGRPVGWITAKAMARLCGKPLCSEGGP